MTIAANYVFSKSAITNFRKSIHPKFQREKLSAKRNKKERENPPIRCGYSIPSVHTHFTVASVHKHWKQFKPCKAGLLNWSIAYRFGALTLGRI